MPAGRGSRNALRAAAVLSWADAVGFGLATIPVARHLAAHGTLPTFFGLFPMYGGGPFEQLGNDRFSRLLSAFRLVCAAEAVAGRLLWKERESGVWLGLAIVPVAAFFWRGFALPLPVANALVRSALVVAGRKNLQG